MTDSDENELNLLGLRVEVFATQMIAKGIIAANPDSDHDSDHFVALAISPML